MKKSNFIKMILLMIGYQLMIYKLSVKFSDWLTDKFIFEK